MKLFKTLILLLPLALFACKQGEEAKLATSDRSTESEVSVAANEIKAGETRFLETGSGKVAFIEKGEGPATILFIHGNSSSKSIFSKQFESSLADRYHLVAFDLPGHGESDDAQDPQNTYTISAYAKLVGELANTLQPKSLVLVGWSLGGHIAIEVAGIIQARARL